MASQIPHFPPARFARRHGFAAVLAKDSVFTASRTLHILAGALRAPACVIELASMERFPHRNCFIASTSRAPLGERMFLMFRIPPTPWHVIINGSLALRWK